MKTIVDPNGNPIRDTEDMIFTVLVVHGDIG